jgi:membrane protease YdiL (CAAX protease family)
MAGFAEEMLFRGLLQRTLEHYRDPAMAIVLTSVLFALAHFNPWVALQITFLGLALGYMAWKSRSILPAVIVHSGNNLLSILLINAPQHNVSWYATEEHVRWIWIALAILLIGPAFLTFSRYCDSAERNAS